MSTDENVQKSKSGKQESCGVCMHSDTGKKESIFSLRMYLIIFLILIFNSLSLFLDFILSSLTDTSIKSCHEKPSFPLVWKRQMRVVGARAGRLLNTPSWSYAVWAEHSTSTSSPNCSKISSCKNVTAVLNMVKLKIIYMAFFFSPLLKSLIKKCPTRLQLFWAVNLLSGLFPA